MKSKCNELNLNNKDIDKCISSDSCEHEEISSINSSHNLNKRLSTLSHLEVFKPITKFVNPKQSWSSLIDEEVDEDLHDLIDPYQINYLLDSDLKLSDEKVLQQIQTNAELREFDTVRELLFRYPGVFKKDQSQLVLKIMFNAIRRKSVWIVKAILEDNFDICRKDTENMNCVNHIFNSFCFRKLKSCAILSLIIDKAKVNFDILYKICNNYDNKNMLPIHQSVRLGDLDAIEYIININK